MDLLEKLRTEEQSRRDAVEQQHTDAGRRYREILLRHARPRAGDAEALIELTATLGLTSHDVAADLEALRLVAELTASLMTDVEIEASQARVREVHGSVILELKKYLIDAIDGFAKNPDGRQIDRLLKAASAIDALRGGEAIDYRTWANRTSNAWWEHKNSVDEDNTKRQRIAELQQRYSRVF